MDFNSIAQEVLPLPQGAALRAVEKYSLRTDAPQYYHALRAEIFLKEHQIERALFEIRKSILANPIWGPAYNIQANIQVELGLYGEALDSFDSAISLCPDIGEFHFNRGQLRLLLGDWGAARQDYEFRLRSPLFQPPVELATRPLWDGTIVQGRRLLAYWEQGLGDTLQFIRFVDLLITQGMDIILEVQESIHSLVAHNYPKVRVIGPYDPLPDFDVRAPIPSLPWLLLMNPETIYAPNAYLRASSVASLSPQHQGKAVGLVWAGNPNHVNDRQRSIPFEQFIDLTQVSDISFYSLQVGVTDRQRRDLVRAGVEDLSITFVDFTETAAAISALDLVITVDTSVAHLAGALGKPVWVLLPFVPDWRWMLNREDSLWYPSARLFRQPSRGDWRTVIHNVKVALNASKQKHGFG